MVFQVLHFMFTVSTQHLPGRFIEIGDNCWLKLTFGVASPNINFIARCMRPLNHELSILPDFDHRLQLPMIVYENWSTDPLIQGTPHTRWTTDSLQFGPVISSTWYEQVRTLILNLNRRSWDRICLLHYTHKSSIVLYPSCMHTSPSIDYHWKLSLSLFGPVFTLSHYRFLLGHLIYLKIGLTVDFLGTEGSSHIISASLMIFIVF